MDGRPDADRLRGMLEPGADRVESFGRSGHIGRCGRCGRRGRVHAPTRATYHDEPQEALVRPRLTLASRILALQIGIVLAVVAAGAVASVFVARQQLDRSYEERSLAVADSVSALPEVRAAVRAGDPDGILQPLAEQIRIASGATFIVVTDDEGIRFSHPNPSRLGEMVSTDPEPALSGQRWSGTQEGTLGVSVRGKVPIRDDDGTVIGMVSVGFLQDRIGSDLAAQLPTLGVYLLAALVLGALASVLLSRHVKSQTFGLEPAEIASLLEQREAVLHGIREGIVAVDLDGRITLVNDEARRLLGLAPEAIGRSVEEMLPRGRVRDVLLGRLERPDQLVVTQGRVLVANRMPVYVRGEVTGSVVSLRDRTELAEVSRELEGVRTVTDALRAQAHEFSNRLHTIVGLVELGRSREAITLSTEDTVVHQELVETLLDRIGDPTLSALLLAKAVVASERGIALGISDDTHIVGELDDVRDLVTIVGNLVDNALDAVAAGPTTTGRWVTVGVTISDEALHVRVHDSGPGIAPAAGDHVFEEGFTTKEPGSQPMRGLGLALVQQVVRRRGGDVSVANDGGAVFTVRLPLRSARATGTAAAGVAR
jgi:two-component system, CitB family, sensor kinase